MRFLCDCDLYALGLELDGADFPVSTAPRPPANSPPEHEGALPIDFRFPFVKPATRI
jgi:hypothetical protein